MADQPHRRTAKPFEPPPWEKERFEELARERERAAEGAAAASAAAAAEMAAAEAGVAEHDAAEDQDEPSGAGAAQAGAPSVTAGAAVAAEDLRVETMREARESEAPGETPLSEARFDTMLMMLKAEEPDSVSEIWKVGIAAGAFLVMMGLVLVVWAGVALARTLESGPTAYLGAGIMGLTGSAFVALGAWLVLRSLRKQGVL